MNGALLQIIWLSFRGAMVQRARRLRRPRYLITFLISVAYFGFLVLPSFLNWSRQMGGAFGPEAARRAGSPAAGIARRSGGGEASGGTAVSAGSAGDLPGGGDGADTAKLVAMMASLAIAASVTAVWAFASSKPALQLSEADIHLLLPAPLPRRKLIELTLWRQQPGLLLGALVLTMFRGYGSPGVRLGRFGSTWAVFTLLSLYSKGASLWKARLRELPPAAARARLGMAIAVAAGYWTAIILALRAALAQAARSPAAAPGGADLRDILHRLAASPSPVLTVLLAPFRWLATAFLAGRAGGGLPGLGGGGPGWPATALFLAALLAANYGWVVRSRARFEDAVVERARRQLDRRRRRPALPALTARARQREPFRLAPTGLPEVAIYWKNLLIPGRRPLARRAAEVALPGVAAWAIGAALGAPLAYVAPVAGAGLMLMVMLPPFAGINLRHDLRMDLLQVEVLRPWPVPGWRLVAAELLAPATTALSWTLTGGGVLLGATLAAAGAHLLPAGALGQSGSLGRWAAASGGGAFGAVLAFCAALLIAGVPITLLSVAIQNLAALILPGWVALGAERRAGSGLAGQRLLVLLGQFLALALGLLPAALAVGAALLLATWMGIPLAPWQAPLLALLGALPLLAEVGLLVRAGGALWDRLDPSEEILNPPE